MLIDHGPLRFSELRQAVPGVSDRLLSERVRELEARGVVARSVEPGPPISVHYDVTPMGRELAPALRRSANGRAPGWPDALRADQRDDDHLLRMRCRHAAHRDAGRTCAACS